MVRRSDRLGCRLHGRDRFRRHRRLRMLASGVVVACGCLVRPITAIRRVCRPCPMRRWGCGLVLRGVVRRPIAL